MQSKLLDFLFCKSICFCYSCKCTLSPAKIAGFFSTLYSILATRKDNYYRRKEMEMDPPATTATTKAREVGEEPLVAALALPNKRGKRILRTLNKA